MDNLTFQALPMRIAERKSKNLRRKWNLFDECD